MCCGGLGADGPAAAACRELQAIAVAVHGQDADVVSEPVEQRAGEALGAQDLGPVFERQVGCDGGRAWPANRPEAKRRCPRLVQGDDQGIAGGSEGRYRNGVRLAAWSRQSRETKPLVREAQRHLAQCTLQPMAVMIAQEVSEKLGEKVWLDVMRPLQAFDVGGRARALSAVVQTLALAKESGVDPEKAMNLVNWSDQ